MSANSIYNIDTWQPSTFYYRDYIVQNSGLYYYSSQDYTSSSSITTDINNGNLNGYIYDRGVNKPYFTWKPNFNYTNENVPRVKKIQFGDSYAQYVPDGINNLLLNYNFTFEGDIHTVTAILHFLSMRNGSESFVFLPPAPQGNLLRFICPKWTQAQKFFNNYTIEANFIQNPV
jgi:phage-related protein